MTNNSYFKSGIIDLKEYLSNGELTHELYLTRDLSFHWANWDQTCLIQRGFCQNLNKNFHLEKMDQSLHELRARPIWLRSKSKMIKTDMYSLYESYLDSRLRMTWFERKDEILFSLGDEQGPYYALTSMKWLDKVIYSHFVMRRILVETYGLRSFRLNAKIPVYFRTNNDLNENNDTVRIHQLSECGVIFKFKDKNYLNKIKNSSILEFFIPIRHYIDFGQLSVNDILKNMDDHDLSMSKNGLLFRLESRILNFYDNAINAKRSPEKEFYIFARYENLAPVGHCIGLKKVFPPLVEKIKGQFVLDLYDLDSLKVG